MVAVEEYVSGEANRWLILATDDESPLKVMCGKMAFSTPSISILCNDELKSAIRGMVEAWNVEDQAAAHEAAEADADDDQPIPFLRTLKPIETPVAQVPLVDPS